MILKNSAFNSMDTSKPSPFIEALTELIKQPLSIKTAYAVMKITKEVEDKNKLFQEAKMNIFEKLGNKNEETGAITIPKDKEQEFFNDLAELSLIEVTIESDPIDLIEEKIQITTSDLMILSDIIKQ